MHKIRLTIYFLFFLTGFVLLPGFGAAQSSLPEFSALTVELWPEFDRPEVLVIYRAELNNNVTLPAKVTFQLPGYVEKMHAVAVEQNGGLYSVETELIEQDRNNDTLTLTFPVESRSIHLEYYDPQILTKQQQERQLKFGFTSNYIIETARFQIQEPLESENFSLSPPASSNFTDSNGLKYQVVEISGSESGDTIELKAAYTRNTDTPSNQLLTEQTSDVQVVTEETASSTDFSLGYLLIGVGILLIVATGGYWWWQNRAGAVSVAPQSQKRSPQTVRKQKPPSAKKRKPATPSGAALPATYCHQCGSALRPDSNFCHICGTQRRQT